MARGFSKVIIVGNVTRDPELRSTPSGTQVCSFSVAVNRSYKDGSGSQVDQVSFFDCSAWGKQGETIAQYVKKGSGILVSGRLEQRSWEDKDGQKRSRVEIVVEDFNFIGGGDGGNGGSYSAGSSNGGSKKNAGDEVAPDDISDGPIDLSEIPF